MAYTKAERKRAAKKAIRPLSNTGVFLIGHYPFYAFCIDN